MEDILKRSKEINAAITSMHKMTKSYSLVDWAKINTTPPNLSGIINMSKTLRSTEIFDLADITPPDPPQRIIKGTMFSNPH